MEIQDFCPRVSLPLSWILNILQIFSFTAVKGQFEVIGSFQPIVAAPGDDVILPCHVQPKFNVRGLTVEWSKPDLQPDPNDRLSRVEYVHLYRDSREDLGMKISSYMRRTQLFTDGLAQGNISLKITNVTLEDAGRYRCFIPKLKGTTQSSILQLFVYPKSAESGTTATPEHPGDFTSYPEEEVDDKGGLVRRSRLIPLIILCVFLILSVGVGGYTKSKCRKKNLAKGPII
ncbi:myelin-oligodendrocyte glycoprotein-like [Mugil cephalus]|uniref:myelin-oligodendrocyte glycoprotein-like n=1 Tax=Mugil cephalus TaxID=48193 RepID=UPI001FB66C84|nr:myelin-oligodendrocyte glycoprotein-like [Mugil cephalus]